MKKSPEEFDKSAHQSDVLDLLRKVVEGLQVSDIDFVGQLEGEERLAYLRWCSEVASSPFFEQTFKYLFYPHIFAAATKAENYDIVTAHRMTANGVSLVKEFFQKQNRTFIEEFEKEAGADKGFQADKPFETSEEADRFFKM